MPRVVLRALLVAGAAAMVLRASSERSLEATSPGANGAIAFTYSQPGSSIMAIEPNGSETRIVVPPGVSSPAHPSWSPDGSQLAFIRSRTEPFARSRLWVGAEDGSRASLVTTAGRRFSTIVSPTWSPDGSHLAYCAMSQQGRFVTALFTIGVDGSRRQKIAPRSRDARDCWPSWSPAGDTLVFETWLSGRAPVMIGVIGTDGRGREILVPKGINSSPDWSPDGSRIVFTRAPYGQTGDIFAMNADGTGRTRLTDDPRGEYDPVFSPDGLTIAFVRERSIRGSTTHVWAIASDGSGSRQLTSTAGRRSDPTWQPR